MLTIYQPNVMIDTYDIKDHHKKKRMIKEIIPGLHQIRDRDNGKYCDIEHLAVIPTTELIKLNGIYYRCGNPERKKDHLVYLICTQQKICIDVEQKHLHTTSSKHFQRLCKELRLEWNDNMFY